MLAPNPFVVLADSAPTPPLVFDPVSQRWQPGTDLDPLSQIGYAARLARTPTAHRGSESIVDQPAVWPYGLGFDVLLGVGALWISTRRLRTPMHKLSRGMRIA